MGDIWLVGCAAGELTRVRGEVLARDARARFLRCDGSEGLPDLARALAGDHLSAALSVSSERAEEGCAVIAELARTGALHDILAFVDGADPALIARCFFSGATEVITAGAAELYAGPASPSHACMGREATVMGRGPGAPADDDVQVGWSVRGGPEGADAPRADAAAVPVSMAGEPASAMDRSGEATAHAVDAAMGDAACAVAPARGAVRATLEHAPGAVGLGRAASSARYAAYRTAGTSALAEDYDEDLMSDAEVPWEGAVVPAGSDRAAACPSFAADRESPVDPIGRHDLGAGTDGPGPGAAVGDAAGRGPAAVPHLDVLVRDAAPAGRSDDSAGAPVAGPSMREGSASVEVPMPVEVPAAAWASVPAEVPAPAEAPTEAAASPVPAQAPAGASAPAAVAQTGPRAPVVTVISGRGGCGKTTLVAAMAACAARGGLRAAVLDLDLMFGNLHTVLGVPTLKGFELVGAHATEEGLAEEDIEGSAMRIGPGLTLWGPCEEAERAELVAASAEQLVEELRGLADVIFIDTSVMWGDAVAMAVEVCDRCVVVGGAGEQAIASTKRVIGLAGRLGVPATRMTCVFNRLGARGSGEEQALQFEMGVSLRSRVRIPDGGDEVAGMASFGHVDSLMAGSSAFAKSVRSFTCEMLRELGCPINGWLLEADAARPEGQRRIRLPWRDGAR